MWPVILIVVVPVSRRATRVVVRIIVRVELIGSVVAVGFTGHFTSPFLELRCYAVRVLTAMAVIGHILPGA